MGRAIPVRSRRSRAGAIYLEALESRVLLSATSADYSADGVQVYVQWGDAGGTAMQGEYTVLMNAGTPDFAALAQRRGLPVRNLVDIGTAAGQEIYAFTTDADPLGVFGWQQQLREEVAAIVPNYVAHVALVSPVNPNANQWFLSNNTATVPLTTPPSPTGWGPASGTNGADAKVPAAWNTTAGSPSVVVADLDTGVDTTHFPGAIWSNPLEIAGNSIDDDGNGRIDDVHGWNFAGSNNSISDDNGHGTATAGVIGAADITNQVLGVDPNATILPVKVLNSAGTGTDVQIENGILYAVALKQAYNTNHTAGANIAVINASFTSYEAFNPVYYNAVLAAQNNGIFVVAAAGNDSSDTTSRFAGSFVNRGFNYDLGGWNVTSGTCPWHLHGAGPL